MNLLILDDILLIHEIHVVKIVKVSQSLDSNHLLTSRICPMLHLDKIDFHDNPPHESHETISSLHLQDKDVEQKDPIKC